MKALKYLEMGEAAGPLRVVPEMINALVNIGVEWLTNLCRPTVITS